MAETDENYAQTKEKRRRGYASVEAIDPRDGGQWQLLLADRTIKYVGGLGRGAALELAYTVRWTLLHPRAIFRGVRDEQRDIAEDDWLCYVSAPGHAYDRKTAERRLPWAGEVFLVFVTDERVIYCWYWCAADTSCCHLPVYYENRFREKLL